MKNITVEELRKMSNVEGLILQGCGGDIKEWLDGMNDLFTENGVLRNGDLFRDVSVFEKDGLTNLFFQTDGIDLDMGKLAIWRIAYHDVFCGTWLSDYVPNLLNGFVQGEEEQQKPDCPLIGENGNVFHLMGMASRTLKENGLTEHAKEMCERISECGSYDQALSIIGEYVNIVSAGNSQDRGGMTMDLK